MHAANPGVYPALTEQQLHKLKLLTVVSIAEAQKVLVAALTRCMLWIQRLRWCVAGSLCAML